MNEEWFLESANKYIKHNKKYPIKNIKLDNVKKLINKYRAANTPTVKMADVWKDYNRYIKTLIDRSTKSPITSYKFAYNIVAYTLSLPNDKTGLPVPFTQTLGNDYADHIVINSSIDAKSWLIESVTKPIINIMKPIPNRDLFNDIHNAVLADYNAHIATEGLFYLHKKSF